MAIPIDIENLINGGFVESNRIEYKADYNPTSILHSICAFANDIENIGGGYIVIGIEEKDGFPVRPVKGIAKNRVDSILKKLLGLCHLLEPFYAPIAEPKEIDGKYIILIWCASGFGRPYKAPKDANAKLSYKYYYIRKFSSSVIASTNEEKELFYISENIPFDDRPNLLSTKDDLDRNLIIDHLKKTGSSLYDNAATLDTETLADDLQLLSGAPENRVPRNVGILMFSSNTQKYFHYARIEVVDIPDPTGTNMTEKTFTGPIQIQLSDALLYIKNYILKEKIIKKNNEAESIRIWNYPFKAVEEILSNAVYHKSYQINEPITVRSTRESLEITSFPGFERHIKDSDIEALNIRGKIYRNRRIGDFLKELRLIEGRNTGFPNAINALNANGSPMLKIEMDEERRFVTVTIPIHPVFIETTKKDRRMAEYNDKIICALKDDSLTITELSRQMGYKAISKKLRTALDKMVLDGTVERIVDSAGNIRYKV